MRSLGDDDEIVGARLRIRASERGDASTPHAVDLRSDPLDVGGMQVASSLDDELLGPAGDVEAARMDEAQIPGLKPAVDERCGARLLVAEVAVHQRPPRDPDLSDHALRDEAPRLVRDLHRRAGDGPSDGDRGVPRRRAGWDRTTEPLERLAVDGERRDSGVKLGEGNREGRLRHAVDG